MMGEYARLHILEHHGIDIGDDDESVKKLRIKKYFCSCSKGFVTEIARKLHQKDTGHLPSKSQREAMNGKVK